MSKFEVQMKRKVQMAETKGFNIKTFVIVWHLDFGI